MPKSNIIGKFGKKYKNRGRVLHDHVFFNSSDSVDKGKEISIKIVFSVVALLLDVRILLHFPTNFSISKYAEFSKNSILEGLVVY